MPHSKAARPSVVQRCIETRATWDVPDNPNLWDSCERCSWIIDQDSRCPALVTGHRRTFRRNWSDRLVPSPKPCIIGRTTSLCSVVMNIGRANAGRNPPGPTSATSPAVRTSGCPKVTPQLAPMLLLSKWSAGAATSLIHSERRSPSPNCKTELHQGR